MRNRILQATLGLLCVASLASLLACSGAEGNSLNSDFDNDCDYGLDLGFTDGSTIPISTSVTCLANLAGDVTVGVTALNNAPTLPGQTVPPAEVPFTVARFDFTYRNANTGRAVPGVDVPFPYSVSPNGVVVVGNTIGTRVLYDLMGLPVLRASAMATAPLNDSSFFNAGTVSFDVFITAVGYPSRDDGAQCSVTVVHRITVDNGDCVTP